MYVCMYVMMKLRYYDPDGVMLLSFNFTSCVFDVLHFKWPCFDAFPSLA